MLYLVTLLTTRRDERGASAVEYGLLVVAVCAGLWLWVELLGVTVIAEFKHQNENICANCSTP